jgi:Tol biopolymer transport system component
MRLLALMMLIVGLLMLRVHDNNPMSQWVAFTDEAFYNSGTDLYRIRLDGLLFDELVSVPTSMGQPSWSPDGQTLAYIVRSKEDIGGLYIISMDRKRHDHIQTLAPPEQVAWSPTGEWLAYQARVDYRDRIYLIRPDGSDEHLLLPEDMSAKLPTWSPDGSALSFNSCPNECFLFYVDLSARNVQAFGHRPFQIGSREEVTWSPDGEWLFVSAEQAIWRVNIATGDDNQITLAQNPRMSPDGLWAVYRGAPGIRKIQVDGTQEQILADQTGDGWTPVWSPDGEWILFTTARTGRLTLHLIRPDGSDARFLTNIFDYDSVPQWSTPIALHWQKWLSPFAAILLLLTSLFKSQRKSPQSSPAPTPFFKLTRP